MNNRLILIVIALLLGVSLYAMMDDSNVEETTKTKVTPIVEVTKKVESAPALMEIKEGVHYDVLPTHLTLPPHKGTVISEFFWFGCPHCQNFEAHVLRWKEKLNKEIPTVINKVAVPGSARWNSDAKVFYTMKKLGATEEQVTQMLGFYKNEVQSNNQYPSEDSIIDLFEEMGLDSEKATAILTDDSSLKYELSNANSEFLKLSVGGVPAFVVNGKYKVRFDNIKSNDEIYEIFRALSHKK